MKFVVGFFAWFLLLVGSSLAQTKLTEADLYVLQAKPLPAGCEALNEASTPVLERQLKSISTAKLPEKIKLAAQLGQSCNRNAVESLTGLLGDQNYEIRIAGIKALGQLGDEESIDALKLLATDPDWRVRFVLGETLCQFQKQPSSYAALNVVGAPLSEGMYTEQELLVRCNALLHVNQLRDVSFSRKALRYMFVYTNLEDPKLKAIAVNAMHELKKTKNFSIELIAELKQAINPSYKKSSAYWIGELKIERGRDILTSVAASDKDPEVRKVAAEALKKLGEE